jgi:hypothetical protein
VFKATELHSTSSLRVTSERIHGCLECVANAQLNFGEAFEPTSAPFPIGNSLFSKRQSTGLVEKKVEKKVLYSGVFESGLRANRIQTLLVKACNREPFGDAQGILALTV